MGHVDHGKTSLLDAIRLANVAEKEAGGITQHIGAYHVEKNGRKIVFIDTPGHEAFTRMRARGAKVTDIVVLVVAADDGVMPQTLEAIDHAKAAGVPIIVAINKIDKPNAQPERVKQQLADRGLLAEDWGGDTVMVPVSARQKTNLDLLLEMILLVAGSAGPEGQSRRGPPWARCSKPSSIAAAVRWRRCWCATARCDVGDYFICGSVFGKVRAMFDDRGEPVREVEPSMPVEVLGLESLPEVGDTFQVVTDTAKAKQIVIYREAKAREVAMAKTKPHHARPAARADEGRRGQGAATSSSRPTSAARPRCCRIRCRSCRTRRSRFACCTPASARSPKPTCCWLRRRTRSSSGSMSGRSATPQAVAEQEKVDIRLHTIIYEPGGRDQEGHDRHAGAGLQGSLQGPGRGARRVPHHQGRQRWPAASCTTARSAAISEVRLLRDNVVVHTGKIELAQALQERRQRSEERLRVRHLARQLTTTSSRAT